jgi:hypothetical protein
MGLLRGAVELLGITVCYWAGLYMELLTQDYYWFIGRGGLLVLLGETRSIVLC